ncbi:hypothetical protein H8356DRAFT_1329849 [Neocallimastix lanati (nom. inval.)]|nr:hypothetical protein H8356DRAFT_1329849 [Neocallimastix sp. JGI-2020a]
MRFLSIPYTILIYMGWKFAYLGKNNLRSNKVLSWLLVRGSEEVLSEEHNYSSILMKSMKYYSCLRLRIPAEWYGQLTIVVAVDSYILNNTKLEVVFAEGNEKGLPYTPLYKTDFFSVILNHHRPRSIYTNPLTNQGKTPLKDEKLSHINSGSIPNTNLQDKNWKDYVYVDM